MRAIIPDLHADPRRLDASLAAAGAGGLAFLGDFIDAFPGAPADGDLAVLRRVRDLIDDHGALAVMGNHELNAILFHRRDTAGAFLRPHSAKNLGQHQSFIQQFGIETPQALDWTGWFLRALPLWRDAGSFRLVHACWSDAAVRTIRARRPDARLQPEDLPEIASESTDFGRAVKLLVSGPEATVPGWKGFLDHKGNRRRQVRLSWWSGGPTWRDQALSIPDPLDLPDDPVPAELTAPRYPADAPPVFAGHYKMRGAPRLDCANVLCLDYPASPCLYLHCGEAALDPRNLRVLAS
ncbi:MAG: hypothetical protein QM682_06610 [Paracoccus sp. (in: a-proteobacteria)]|uniref:hypothetical protein n=1 Tax=Paracoccus sp. TaxID=267 RepID=UPI0039E6440E